MKDWRWTNQRKVIMQSLVGRTDHPTAEELYHDLRNQGAEISLPTVYRNLRALAREGEVLELRGAGPDRFDPATHPHYHFRCSQCDKVFDVDIPYRAELDQVDLGRDLVQVGHEIMWVGVCPLCRGKDK